METEHVALASDTPGQDFSIRVLRFRGQGDGPAVYLQAALHAHEFPGMVALDRLIPMLEQAEAQGRIAGDITVVPHANPIGLAQGLNGEVLGRFDFHSRLNYNRSFPSGTPESRVGRPADDRLKATLLAMATSADIVLDLHCDDEGPVYLYVGERQVDQGLELARAIGAEDILFDRGDAILSFDIAVLSRWAAEERPGDTRFAATVEYRGMRDVTHAYAQTDAEGLYRYLAQVGAVRDTPAPIVTAEPLVAHIDDAELIHSPVPGAILYDVAIGDRVEKGQRLAAILPEPGSPPHDLCAPFAGTVMTLLQFRFVRRGDHALKVLRADARKPGE